jgi:hypothetical protein
VDRSTLLPVHRTGLMTWLPNRNSRAESSGLGVSQFRCALSACAFRDVWRPGVGPDNILTAGKTGGPLGYRSPRRPTIQCSRPCYWRFCLALRDYCGSSTLCACEIISLKNCVRGAPVRTSFIQHYVCNARLVQTNSLLLLTSRSPDATVAV